MVIKPQQPIEADEENSDAKPSPGKARRSDDEDKEKNGKDGDDKEKADSNEAGVIK